MGLTVTSQSLGDGCEYGQRVELDRTVGPFLLYGFAIHESTFQTQMWAAEAAAAAVELVIRCSRRETR